MDPLDPAADAGTAPGPVITVIAPELAHLVYLALAVQLVPGRRGAGAPAPGATPGR
jgi:hypothetical protein